MASLWTTASEDGSEIFVDFLSNFSESDASIPHYEFIDWDVQSINTDWQRKFLDIELKSIKHESIADTFEHRGGEQYKQNFWRESMECFNQALCYTETDSIHLNTLFAKRALCFGQMGMYESAIIDADIALTSNLPSQKRSKIQKKKAEWQELLTAQGQSQTHNVPALSFDADNECPSMANVLEIVETDDIGSHIVARTDIDVGQVILVETGFVSVANGYDRAYCVTCLKTLANFFPCPKCTDAMFCNIDCMTANNVHKIWCNEPYNRMPIDIRFVIESILQAITLFPTVDLLMEFVSTIQHLDLESAENAIDYQREPKLFDYGLFLSLLSTPDDQADDLALVLIYKVYQTLISMSSIQLKFDTEVKRRFLMHLVGHHAQVLKNNAFGGVFEDKIDERKQFVAGNVSSIAALFEHSCAPNLMHFPIGNREIFVTLRPITAGEHLNFDYWLKWPNEIKSDNWTTNIQSKGIHCECGKCEHHTMDNENMNANQSYQIIKDFGNEAVAPILQQHCINFLRTFRADPWTKEVEMVTKKLAQCFLSQFHVER